MTELRSLEMNVLVDLLAVHTNQYLQLSDGISRETEYAKCVLTIKAIQAEIDIRKRTSANTNTTNPDIMLND